MIDSIKDDRIAAARGLATRAGRAAAGRCLLEGPTLIGQVLGAGGSIDYVLRADTAADDGLGARLAAAGVPVHEVRDGLLRKVTGGAKPVGWLAVAALPAEVGAAGRWGDFAVVCESVADPGNLGTIVRTAAALGVRDVVLTDEDTDLGSRRVLDAARGAVLAARVRRFADPAHALEALRTAGFQVVATSPRGRQVQSLAPLAGPRVALVVGNETAGASEATLAAADLVVQIPMAGAVESLNVGVAAGIGIYELRMRMVLAMLTDRIRSSLGRDLAATARLVRTAFDDELRTVTDLSGDQVVALMVLSCDRATPRARLRTDLGVGADELTGLLDPLVERGYVGLDADADAVTVTAAGEQAVAALWLVQERVQERLYAGFTDADRAALTDLLHRVQRNATATP